MDINSSYPDKAANYKLPYGDPVLELVKENTPDMSKFWVADALVKFKLKSKDHLPCIPSKAITEGKPLEIEKWMGDSGHDGQAIVRMTFSNIDYFNMKESYDFEVVRWLWSIHWAWKVHKEVAKFVNKNNDLKVKYTELARKEKDPQKKIEFNTIRNRAKIDNNSFYGKFGEDIIKHGKTPYWEEDGEGNEEIVWRVDREDEQGEHNRKFLPVAIAITAWGRHQLVKMANLLGEHFLYCDTDSVHYLKSGQYKIDQAVKEKKIEVHHSKLGLGIWKGTLLKVDTCGQSVHWKKEKMVSLKLLWRVFPADPHTGNFKVTLFASLQVGVMRYSRTGKK